MINRARKKTLTHTHTHTILRHTERERGRVEEITNTTKKMRLTVCNQTNESNIAQIEIDSNAPLVNLQAMIAIELNISEEKQILMHNGKVLIGDDDIVETNAETSTIAS